MVVILYFMMYYRTKSSNLFLLKSALVTLLGVGDIKCYYIKFIHKNSLNDNVCAKIPLSP